MIKTLLSWGRYPRSPQIAHYVDWPNDVLNTLSNIASQNEGRTLAYGMGRSYGDSCLAESGHVIATSGMGRIISADWVNGIVHAQAGLTLAELINIALPKGWFLPVTPGTKFVTLGGAVANDVHGKNHHVKGTFGCHIRKITLYRTDEGVVDCQPDQRPDLFAATIGGLGLTGVILSVEIQLRHISSNQIKQRSIRFGGLDEFFALSEEYDQKHEYTVAWIDCLASKDKIGRGHYIAGDHIPKGTLEAVPDSKFTMPFDPPISLVNPLSLKAFNMFFYNRQLRKEIELLVNYAPFFYPLDGLLHWNRIYGKQGFQQYQCVVPRPYGKEIIRSLMEEIAKSNTGSFLAVLKQCGDIVSPGLLSFPMPGVSLALDFPQHEKINRQLFARLDAIVHEARGRLYPAKDAHMNATHFQQAYPLWQQLEALRDPKLLSQFWKRVTQ
jgi:FAD/FMN-containing dehydrogenase